MAGEGISLQDIIKRRQQADFVGRGERLAEFQANLGLPVTDPARRFVFNVHGVAGVGKTFLTHQFRRVAEQRGAACAYADENYFDVLETMVALSADLARQGRKLADFEKRLDTYRKRRHELEADSKAPVGGLLTKSAVQIGLTAARTVPVLGIAAEAVDAEQVDQLRLYLSKKFRSSEDVRLVLSPVEVLTRVFVADLGQVARKQPVALFFDTFERTAPYLEGWLLDLLASRHGNLPAELMITIAGQAPLDANRWSPYRGLIADVPLAPFTEAEARELLASRGVRDEQVIQVILTLSGRLPVWLATLADHRPTDQADVTDPTDDAVARFLKWEPDESRRGVVLAGALPRKLNEDVLAAVCGDAEAFNWLRRLPFVTETSGQLRYHDVARAPMLRLHRRRSPQRWREQHRQLVAYYRAEREAQSGAWQDHRLEENYHRVCADPATALPAVLGYAVTALAESMAMARRWAAMLTAAGRESGTDTVGEWGERLANAVRDDDSDGIAFLTALIDGGGLEPDALKLALRQRGRAHRRAEQVEPALADFTRAIGLDPHDKWSISNRGQAYADLGRFDEAIADFTRAAELDPNYRWAFAERGRTHRLAGRLDEAITDLTRAVELDPSYDWAFAERGRTHRLAGRFDEAIADFTRAIELDPNYRWAIAGRGETHRLAGRFDEAIADFTRAIELEPKYGWAIARRGETYRLAGRFDEAIADFTRAIELEPKYGWAIGQRGHCYASVGRFDDAIADIAHAMEVHPRNSWPHYQRGLVRLMRDEKDLAVADLRTAVELGERQIEGEPTRPVHKFNLAVYRAALSEWAEAERLLVDTLDREPAPGDVADVLDDLAELSRVPGVDRERVDTLVRLVEEHRR